MPICRVMTDSGCQIAPPRLLRGSRPPSARSLSDARGDERIVDVRGQGLTQALGARKTWRLLNAQQGHGPVARCTLERRMRALGIARDQRYRAGQIDTHHPPRALRRTARGPAGPRLPPLLAPTSAGRWTSPMCAPGRDSAVPRS